MKCEANILRPSGEGYQVCGQEMVEVGNWDAYNEGDPTCPYIVKMLQCPSCKSVKIV